MQTHLNHTPTSNRKGKQLHPAWNERERETDGETKKHNRKRTPPLSVTFTLPSPASGNITFSQLCHVRREMRGERERERGRGSTKSEWNASRENERASDHALAAVIAHFLCSVPVLSASLPELIQLAINLPKSGTQRQARNYTQPRKRRCNATSTEHLSFTKMHLLLHTKKKNPLIQLSAN